MPLWEGRLRRSQGSTTLMQPSRDVHAKQFAQTSEVPHP